MFLNLHEVNQQELYVCLISKGMKAKKKKKNLLLYFVFVLEKMLI